MAIFQKVASTSDGVEAGGSPLSVPAHEFALEVDSDGLPKSSDVNRFHQAIYLPDFEGVKQGQVHVAVLGLSAAAVAIELTEIVPKEGRDSSHRRVVIRGMHSFEPVFIWLQNGLRCWIEPETSWGGVHRHTGLGVSMKLDKE